MHPLSNRQSGFALAVPRAALRQDGERSRLTIDGAGWRHLTAWLDAAAAIDTGDGADDPALRAALAQAALAARHFGSRRQDRAVTVDAAQSMSEAPDTPPYPAFIDWLQQLRDGAASVAEMLRTPGAGTAADNKARLASLSGIAAAVRTRIQPLIASLGRYQGEILAANHAITEGAAASAGQLTQAQEQVGALQVQADGLRQRIDKLGLLHAHRKPELMRQLANLRTSLDQQRAQAESQRSRYAVIEAMLADGAWLDGALGELAAFLDQARSAWTAFGSGVAQLAADASPAELADPALIDERLGRSAALPQWQALADAAGQFVAQVSMVAPDEQLAPAGRAP